MKGMWSAGFLWWRMGAEAQAVMGMRMMGMMGLWNTAPSEWQRMVAEKQTAAMRSGFAAMRAAAKGRNGAQVAKAAMRPVRARTRANVRRLARRGMV